MKTPGFTRRDLLAGAAGALTAAGRLLPQAPSKADAARLGWTLTLHSATFRDLGFLELVGRCPALDIHSLEGWPDHLLDREDPELKLDLNHGEARETVQIRLAEKRILMPAYGPVALPAGDEAGREFLENCKKVGVLTVVTVTPPTAAVERLCGELGMQAAWHPPAEGGSPEKMGEALKGFGPRVGVCADPGPWMRAGLDPVESLRKLKGRILHVHPKDLDAEKKEVPWGEGTSNLRGQLAELKAQGYKGFFSIEYEGHDAEDHVRRCAEFFHRACNELAG